MLIKIPATRSVLTLLLLGFLLTLAGLWSMAPLQLLLQPGLFGLVLAVAAAVIDGYLKRKRTSTILTLSSPSDFVAPGSTESVIDQGHILGIGSDEPTAVRPASPPRSEPISSSSESEAGV